MPDVCPWVMGHAAPLPEHRIQGASESPQGGTEGVGNAAARLEYRRSAVGLTSKVISPAQGLPGAAGHFQSTEQGGRRLLSLPGAVFAAIPFPTAGPGREQPSREEGRRGGLWAEAPKTQKATTFVLGVEHPALPACSPSRARCWNPRGWAGVGLPQLLGVPQVAEPPGLLVSPDCMGFFCCDWKWR